ncbi:hypothetical protein O1611_g8818 [Lasiodiplodia mahajangana]|uniref:Uncharacterized protein n=1 Tax=Lasiodiplodia mahajangana TaxID=1108764 RepID=A0ACC2JBU4_9PEZI|nr:hypothetical protein O1611_g8818 [Lasiodiplodia mahajangana]
MANPPRPRGQIKRVPVPSHHPVPASASAYISTAATSSPAFLQTALPDQSSITLNSTAHDLYRLRGPIPLVATNSHEPLPASLGVNHQFSHLYSLHTAQMDLESQNRQTTLPPQVEDDIKAAVLASMPPPGRPLPTRRRKTVIHRKNLRWASLSFCIILIVGEIPVSVIYGVDVSALFVFILATLLAFWDGWRLFRLRQTFDNEIISGWHVGLEVTFLSAIIAITAVIATWVSNWAATDSSYLDTFKWEHFWAGIAVALLFLICIVLHSVLLVITVIEKWTKPASPYMELSANAQPQQTPQIIFQVIPACPTCHSHIDVRRQDDDSSRAVVGDSQPQGVAPAPAEKGHILRRDS